MGVLVLVDDNVQSGASLAALDQLLGARTAVSAFAVGITDVRVRADAYTPRSFRVTYDPDREPLVAALHA